MLPTTTPSKATLHLSRWKHRVADRTKCGRIRRASTSPSLRAGDRLHVAGLRVRQHRGHPQRDHLHRRRRRHPALSRLCDRGARGEVHLPRGRLAAHLRGAAHRRRARGRSRSAMRRHTLLHEDLRRFFDALPSNAHPMPVLSSAVSALSTYYERLAQTRTTPSRSSCPPSGCWPSCRSSPRTRTRRASGRLPVPRQLAELRRQLLQAELRHVAEPYEVNPVLTPGAGAAAHPARGPRAERVHLDGAAGRLDRGEHVRLDLGGHQRPLRAAARRRERGRAEDARRASRSPARASRSTSSG